MSKGTTFADKVKKSRGSAQKMARIVISERKPNGHYSFRNRMVPLEDAKDAIKEATAK